ncbi:adenylosuccinate synthase [Alcaligenes faecalis]|nr:adenylosuccinate synthase [Alcaligenes faecalis]
MTLTHDALCDLAVKWLKRPHSQNGHGCNVAVSEARSGRDGEIPDAIGFRIATPNVGSVVVECKVSRSDFLADKAKPHRKERGMGHWRYFMCPEGLIDIEDLPEGWGLLWVNQRSHIKIRCGAATGVTLGYDAMKDVFSAWRQNANEERERFLLIKLLSRVGDADQLNRWIREANTERQRIARIADDRARQLRELQAELTAIRLKEWSTTQ